MAMHTVSQGTIYHWDVGEIEIAVVLNFVEGFVIKEHKFWFLKFRGKPKRIAGIRNPCRNIINPSEFSIAIMNANGTTFLNKESIITERTIVYLRHDSTNYPLFNVVEANNEKGLVDFFLIPKELEGCPIRLDEKKTSPKE